MDRCMKLMDFSLQNVFDDFCFSAKYPYMVIKTVIGLYCQMHTHTQEHVHVFAAQISKEQFFPWRNFSFHVKKKRVPPSPLSHFLHGVPEGTWPACRSCSRDQDNLNSSRWELMVNKLPAAGVYMCNWDQYACMCTDNRPLFNLWFMLNICMINNNISLNKKNKTY